MLSKAMEDVSLSKQLLDSLLNNDINLLYENASDIKQLSKKQGRELEYALAEMYIGMYYSRMSVHNKALTFYFNAIPAFKESQDAELLSQLYSSIGATYRHLKDFKKAKEFATLAFQASPNAENKVKAKILNRIGDMHRDIGDIDSAFIFYRKSLEFSKGNIVALGDNYNNIGDLYKALSNYDSSAYYYNRSISVLSQGGSKSEIAENYVSLAELNLKFNRKDDAIKNISNAINILESMPPMYELNNAYNTAINIYQTLNMKDSLNKYLFKLIELERITAKQQLDKTISAVEIEQSLKNKEIQVELLKKQSELKDRTNYFLIAIVLLVVIIGISLWRQIKLKKKENKLLIEQNEIIRQAKEELQAAYDNINGLNATKDKFFSIIAHDLRNPLGSFKMVVNLLYDFNKDLSEQEKMDFIIALKETADSLGILLENLLEWSRSQRNLIVFNPIETDLQILINNTIQILKPSADNKSIRLASSIESSTVLMVDSNLLNTVIRNLISNAIKFTPDGGTISIDIADSNQESLTIAIKDTGIGMALETIDKLFKLDKNISTKGTANESGTGLGLILCKEFIEKHNGKLWVDSTLGEGSTFYVQIPKGY